MLFSSTCVWDFVEYFLGPTLSLLDGSGASFVGYFMSSFLGRFWAEVDTVSRTFLFTLDSTISQKKM